MDPTRPQNIPPWKWQKIQSQEGAPTQPSSSQQQTSQQRQQGYAVRHQPPSTLTPQQQAQRQRVLMTQEGVPPKPKETPMTAGQAASKSFADVGRNIWYGKQTGPEQIWQAPDVRYSYGPSTKSIMAENLANVGVGLTAGGVVRVAAPAAATATGWLKTVYRGSKVAMGGAAVVGTGAYGYQSYQQLKEGDTRSFAAGTLGFTSGMASFGVGAGAFEPRYKTSEMLNAIKKAGEINIRTGTPGSIQAGMRGTLEGSDILNTQTTIIRNNMKVGERFVHTEDYVYKPSGHPELFSETEISKTGGKVISLGSSEALNKIIPGVEKPVRTDILTGIEYRTETGGKLRSTRAFIYNKYEPEFKPYSETSALRFTKQASDIINKPSKIKLESSSYKGGTIESGGRVFEYRKTFSELKMEEPPVFRVYPPESTFTVPVSLSAHRDITAQTLNRMYGSFSMPAYDTQMRTPSKLKDFIVSPQKINIDRTIQSPFVVNLPKQNTDFIRRQTFDTMMDAMSRSVKDSQQSFAKMTQLPSIVFPRKKLEGGGGEIADLQRFLSRYKFREFKIPELRL